MWDKVRIFEDNGGPPTGNGDEELHERGRLAADKSASRRIDSKFTTGKY